MKAAILLPLLASLVGGGVGTALTLGVVGKPEAKAEREPASEADDTDEANDAPDSAPGANNHDGAAGRIRAVEHRVALLTRALAQGAAGGGDAADEDGLIPEGASDVADPVFEAAVLDIFDREQERKEEEKNTHRTNLQAQRSKKAASSLASSLSLSDAEQEKVSEVVNDYFQSFRDLRDSPDRPATRREWRDKAQEMQKAMETRLQEVLTGPKYQK